MSDEFIYDPTLIERHKEVREEFSWGSFGTSGRGDLKRTLLKDLASDHILNIILTQAHADCRMFTTELYYRLRDGYVK